MPFTGFKNNWVLLAVALFFLLGGFCCAQNKRFENLEESEVLHEKMERDSDFFDALKFRKDLNFNFSKRILYTTIKDIKAFNQMYKDTDMSLEFIIRDRLHTAIFLNQKKNHLQSMDGSEFSLYQNINAEALTDQLVSLISRMYYGAHEVKALFQ